MKNRGKFLKSKYNQNSYKWYNRIAALLVMSTMSLLPLSNVASAAGSAHFSLAPASGSFKKGTTFNVTVREDSGAEQVSGVEADLTYDATKLKYNSVSNSSSAFDFYIPQTSGNGSVKIAVAKSGQTGLTGLQTVATVSFTVLGGSGSTSIRFASSSSINQYTGTGTIDLWDGNTNGATLTLTGTPTSGGGSTGGGGGTTTNTTTTTTKTTTSTKKTSTPTKNTTKATAPTASGYLVAIKVTDNDNKPVKDAKVTLDGAQPISYDSSGVANFFGIAAGDHTVTVTAKDKTTTKKITVTAGNTFAVQEFAVAMDIGLARNMKILIAAAAVVLLLLIIGGGTGLTKLIRSAKSSSELSKHFLTPSSPVATAPPAPAASKSSATTAGQIISPGPSAGDLNGPKL